MDDNLKFGEKIILSFFANKNEITGKTRLQKLIFLMEKELLSKDYLGFTAWLYGPYSDQLERQLNGLIYDKFINAERIDKENYNFFIYSITDLGQNALRMVDDDLIEKAKIIVDKYGHLTYSELLDFVYSKYKEFTYKSIL